MDVRPLLSHINPHRPVGEEETFDFLISEQVASFGSGGTFTRTRHHLCWTARARTINWPLCWNGWPIWNRKKARPKRTVRSSYSQPSSVSRWDYVLIGLRFYRASIGCTLFRVPSGFIPLTLQGLIRSFLEIEMSRFQQVLFHCIYFREGFGDLRALCAQYSLSGHCFRRCSRFY